MVAVIASLVFIVQTVTIIQDYLRSFVAVRFTIWPFWTVMSKAQRT